jgi:enoyl-CoA hydratase/carnithine racemase
MQTRNLPTVILFEMDTPVIGVINGAAAGYGLDLALGCDMRLMARSATLLPGFAKRGVVPESGGTWYLTAAAGLGQGGRGLLPGPGHRRRRPPWSWES